MTKQKINVFDYAKEITDALSQGVLLTTKKGEKINTMTIGWGTLGIIWEKHVFIAFIREGRFTRKQLDASMEFTVNIPYRNVDKKVLGYCGSRTGQHTDKIQELKLTTVSSETVQAPGLLEFPLTLECKVLYQQLQDKNSIPLDIQKAMYPQNVDSSSPMANRDFHIAYYGEIVNAYIIQK